jgi:CheY-like chemotaxis protein
MKTHLLLIDDDIDEFDFIAPLLRDMPTLKFSYACNGRNGIELMAAELPDVVLLDMNMPAMNGLECLKKIKKTEALKSIPVFMYSNGYSDDLAREARLLGANDCFKKPASERLLRKILSQVLDDPECQR